MFPAVLGRPRHRFGHYLQGLGDPGLRAPHKQPRLCHGTAAPRCGASGHDARLQDPISGHGGTPKLSLSPPQTHPAGAHSPEGAPTPLHQHPRARQHPLSPPPSPHHGAGRAAARLPAINRPRARPPSAGISGSRQQLAAAAPPPPPGAVTQHNAARRDAQGRRPPPSPPARGRGTALLPHGTAGTGPGPVPAGTGLAPYRLALSFWGDRRLLAHDDLGSGDPRRELLHPLGRVVSPCWRRGEEKSVSGSAPPAAPSPLPKTRGGLPREPGEPTPPSSEPR